MVNFLYPYFPTFFVRTLLTCIWFLTLIQFVVSMFFQEIWCFIGCFSTSCSFYPSYNLSYRALVWFHILSLYFDFFMIFFVCCMNHIWLSEMSWIFFYFLFVTRNYVFLPLHLFLGLGRHHTNFCHNNLFSPFWWFVCYVRKALSRFGSWIGNTASEHFSNNLRLETFNCS